MKKNQFHLANAKTLSFKEMKQVKGGATKVWQCRSTSICYNSGGACFLACFPTGCGLLINRSEFCVGPIL